MQVFYIFICLILLALPGSVQANSLPPTFQSLWALPDCAVADRLAYHSETHVLYIHPDRAVMDRSSVIKKTSDYYVLQNGPLVYPVQILEDGIMVVGITDKDAVIDDRLPWSAQPIKSTREYMRCEMAPPVPHDFAPKAMSALDILEKACRYGTNDGCILTLMLHFDTDTSATINKEEAVRAVLVSMYLQNFIDYQFVSNANVMTSLEDSFNIAVKFVDRAFQQMDTDLSGDLNDQEFLNALPLLSRDIMQQRPYSAITKLMSIYPRLYQ